MDMLAASLQSAINSVLLCLDMYPTQQMHSKSTYDTHTFPVSIEKNSK